MINSSYYQDQPQDFYDFQYLDQLAQQEIVQLPEMRLQESQQLEIDYSQEDIESLMMKDLDQQIEKQPEYQKYELMLKPWMNKAKLYLQLKYPQLIVKNTALAAGIVIKFCRAKIIISNCSKVAFGVSKALQGTSMAMLVSQHNLNYAQTSFSILRAGGLVADNIREGSEGIQAINTIALTPNDILASTVSVAGGNLASSCKVFKDSITNKTTWMLTAGIFIAEVGLLNYQRFCSKTIDQKTYLRRVASSFFSNAAGVLGGSSGAFIGTFVGNLISPGIGGFIGSLVVGLIGSVCTAKLVDELIDPQSYSIEKYEEFEVSEKEKQEAYIKACEAIQVPPGAPKQRIKDEMKIQYLRFHPDKHVNEPPQEKEYYEKKFIEVRISYEFIKQYRMEKNTWE